MVKNWQLSKNKNLEIQIELGSDLAEWFVLCLETRTEQDHPGVVFRFELLKKLYFSIIFYDSRHYEEIYNGNKSQSNTGC